MNTHIHKNKIVISLLSLIAALIVFQAGVFVGYHKAFSSYSGGDRFYRMMEGEQRPQGPQMGFQAVFDDKDDFLPSHGVTGRIVSVSLPSFIVAAPNNLEKTVLVNDKTITRKFRDTVTSSDIHVNDFVIVLGEPDQSGTIEAKFVRLTPASALSSSTSLNVQTGPMGQSVDISR